MGFQLVNQVALLWDHPNSSWPFVSVQAIFGNMIRSDHLNYVILGLIVIIVLLIVVTLRNSRR